jgi:hypothetical protein
MDTLGSSMGKLAAEKTFFLICHDPKHRRVVIQISQISPGRAKPGKHQEKMVVELTEMVV